MKKEHQSKFLKVYSSIRKEAIATVDEISRAFSLASSTTQKLLGDTGDLMLGFGYGPQKSLELSKRTIQLAIYLAAFHGCSNGVSDAIEALVKLFVHERKAIMGIVIRDEIMEEELIAMGKQNLTGFALARVKVEAILNIAYRQSKDAIDEYLSLKKSEVEKKEKHYISLGNKLYAYEKLGLVKESKIQQVMIRSEKDEGQFKKGIIADVVFPDKYHFEQFQSQIKVGDLEMHSAITRNLYKITKIKRDDGKWWIFQVRKPSIKIIGVVND